MAQQVFLAISPLVVVQVDQAAIVEIQITVMAATVDSLVAVQVQTMAPVVAVDMVHCVLCTTLWTLASLDSFQAQTLAQYYKEQVVH